MILTYKVKHNKNFSNKLSIAKKIADFAIQNRNKLSTKYISHLGLKSVIANQILRKYGRNNKAKVVKSVNMIIPNQGINFKENIIEIPCLKLSIPFDRKCEKINQIELNKEFAFISITIKENKQFIPKKTIGIDLNTTGHCAVAVIKETGKVYKLGKTAEHIHKKYKNIRKNLQKRGLYKVVKNIKNREQRIVRDINHKISRFIVNKAVSEKAEIKMENLEGIRQTTKSRKSFKYALNSWSFYQLKTFIEYKALLAGIKLSFVEPAYTSKCCSKCGQIGQRNDKIFKCPNCGYVEHADVNAAFNLAFTLPCIVQLQTERDVCKGSTDTPRKATQSSLATLEPRSL